MRVTDGMMSAQLVNDLQTVQAQMLQSQQQLTSGQRINVPSDDPVGAENVLRWQNALDQNTQYQTNAKDAVNWLESGSTALQTAVGLVQRIRSLAVSVSPAGMTPTQEQAIAVQVQALGSALLQAANTKVGDHYLFSGDATSTRPFTQTGSTVAYAGGTGSIRREVSPGMFIQVNATGNSTFTPVFNAIAAILYDLGPSGNVANVASNSALTGNNPYNPGPGGDLAQLDAALNGMIAVQGQVGAQMQQAQQAQTQLTSLGLSLQKLRAGTLDADLPQAVVEMQQLQVSYQSALAAGARLIQPTLANFLQ